MRLGIQAWSVWTHSSPHFTLHTRVLDTPYVWQLDGFSVVPGDNAAIATCMPAILAKKDENRLASSR